MKARKFNNLMPSVNHQWAAKVLGMLINPKKGPDLIDEYKAVELKFTLAGDNHKARRYPRCWTVLEYQMKYNDSFPSYWGLGTYELTKPIKEIKIFDLEDLEKLVSKRELWIVPWKWMEQFPSFYTSGETFLSSWENTLRYPKLRDIPKIQKTYEVSKGLLHLTKGVKINHFQFLESDLPF